MTEILITRSNFKMKATKQAKNGNWGAVACQFCGTGFSSRCQLSRQVRNCIFLLQSPVNRATLPRSVVIFQINCEIGYHLSHLMILKLHDQYLCLSVCICFIFVNLRIYF